MIYILGCKKACKTLSRMREILPHDQYRVMTRNYRPLQNYNHENGDIIVRYGNDDTTFTHDVLSGFNDEVINASGSVERASNKVIMKRMLMEHFPDNTPLCFSHYEEAEETGFEGQVVTQRRNGEVFHMPYINKEREFRLLSFCQGNNVSIRLMDKAEGDKTQLLWKHSAGFVFKRIDSSSVPGIKTMAKKLHEVFDLDFYGADIGQTNNGKLWIFEVNSAPGLDFGGINWLRLNIEKRIAGGI